MRFKPKPWFSLLAVLVVLGVAGVMFYLKSGQAAASLTWEPPALSNPTTILVSGPRRTVRLDNSTDYIIKFTGKMTGSLILLGGRNVHIIGGEIDMAQHDGIDESFRRGLYIKDNVGTVHVEGVWIHGPGLADGIAIAAPLSTVQVQNVRIDEATNYHLNPDKIHPDVIQLWGGVQHLRVDRLTGSSHYQGLQVAEDKGSIDSVTLKNIDIDGLNDGRYLIWKSSTYEFSMTNVWIKPSTGRTLYKTLWPEGDPVWATINEGLPPDGSFVPPGTAGLGYASPGYGSRPQGDPGITLHGLSEGQIVNGSFSLEARSVNVIAQKFSFYIDDVLVNAEITAPYCLAGDVAKVCNAYSTASLGGGDHKLRVVMDHSGGQIIETINFVVEVQTPAKPGDANGDGVVNGLDLSAVLTNYGKTNQTRAQGDVTGDGSINGLDLSQILSNYDG